MITISKPRPEDAEAINEVIKKSWYATYINEQIGITREDIDLMYAENEKGQIEVFRKRAINPPDDDISLMAKDGEKVVGFIRLKIFPGYVQVLSLYVHTDYLGKGIGTNLWNEARKLLPPDKSVVAYPAEHTKSIDWYKKMGFVETGEKRVEEAMASSGTRMSLIKMILTR